MTGLAADHTIVVMESEGLLVPGGSVPPSVQPWVERSRRDVFLDALTGVRPGASRPKVRHAVGVLVVIAVAAFLLPNVVVLLDGSDYSLNAPLYLLLISFSVGRGAIDQYRFGRPLSRALIAGAGVVLLWLGILGAFVGFSLVLGQPAEGSRLYAAIDAVIPDIQREVAMLLLSIPVIAIVAILVYRAAQGFPDDPRDAEFKAAMRAERAARAAATGRETAPTFG